MEAAIPWMTAPRIPELLSVCVIEDWLQLERPKLICKLFRAPYRIPGHWPPFAYRDEPYPQALPHAHIRTKYCRREVKILVLLDEVTESQEVERRNCQPQRRMYSVDQMSSQLRSLRY